MTDKPIDISNINNIFSFNWRGWVCGLIWLEKDDDSRDYWFEEGQRCIRYQKLWRIGFIRLKGIEHD